MSALPTVLISSWWTRTWSVSYPQREVSFLHLLQTLGEPSLPRLPGNDHSARGMLLLLLEQKRHVQATKMHQFSDSSCVLCPATGVGQIWLYLTVAFTIFRYIRCVVKLALVITAVTSKCVSLISVAIKPDNLAVVGVWKSIFSKLVWLLKFIKCYQY